MATDVGASVTGEARRGQSRSSSASKTSSKKVKNATESAGLNFSRKGSEKAVDLTREDYVSLLGEDIFEAFTLRREAALRTAAEIRKMKMMTRRSVRYVDSHEQSLTNEFGKFLDFAELQRQKEGRRDKLLGIPPRSAPASIFAVRPTGNFGLREPEMLTREEWNERRASAKSYLKLQMERIQNIRASRTMMRSPKGTPLLQAVDLSDVIRKKTMTPRPSTQFSVEFLQEEPPHYAVLPTRRRPTSVSAVTDADLYRWMEEYFKEHVLVEEVDNGSSRGSRQSSLKEPQLRDEQKLDHLCSIASGTPSYIADSPWHVRRKSTSQRGSKYDHLHSPPAKERRSELRYDVELAAQLHARKVQGLKKSAHPRTPSLGKRKRRPQTAQSSLGRTFVEEDAMDTILNRTVLVKSRTHLSLQEAGVVEIDSVRYISLANRRIGNVNSQDLTFFTSIRCLDLSGNHVPLVSLAPLTALRKLILLGNQQSELEIPEGSFQELEVLDVSYNLLNDMAVIALSSFPSLRKLNLNNNNLEVIPPEATETRAFSRLETLCVAGNSLSSTCLLSLSKLPWLETLHLHNNLIEGIPEQIISMARAFSRLETLNLAENPINYPYKLIALEKMQKLRKVFLWDTPLSRTISYDGSGKCSPRSVPILQAAMRAQRAGQNWFLVKTDNIKNGHYSDKLIYFVDNHQPGMSHDEKLKASLEMTRRVEQEVQIAMLQNVASRRIESGPTSLIAQSPETMDAEVFIADSQKLSFAKKSPRRRPGLEALVNEEMKKLTDNPSLVKPYLSQAQAAVAAARKSLRMSPRKEKDTTEQRQGSQADELFLPGNIVWKQVSDTINKRSPPDATSKRPPSDKRKRTSANTNNRGPATEQRKRSTKPKHGA